MTKRNGALLGRARARWRAAGLAALAAAVSIGAASSTKADDAAGPTSLHARALAAVPAARHTLDRNLADYPSARFKDVHARIVQSVYSDDDGDSNKVPWTHRGAWVLVLCGEINAKNQMGGYTGWTPFVFEPAQSDIVTMYGFQSPRLPQQLNLARHDELSMAGGAGIDDKKIALLCSESPKEADPIDLADALQSHGAGEGQR